MSSGGPLAGVVVFVDVTNEGGLNATSLFSKKLASLGALVVERLSRAVTHVVFKGAPDALRALHDRLAKLGAGAHRHVVSVAWVVACEASRAKAEEGAHAQVRPADTLASLVASPTYVRGGGGSSKKRKSMAPQPVQRYGACGPHTLRWSAQTHSSHSVPALAVQIWTWRTQPSRPRSCCCCARRRWTAAGRAGRPEGTRC